ncbi:MBL fold metallo-hydrolase [Thiotrichales bacterium 19S3-7]|nr:MBL fold metallo-hydrolase [Thiotrichales bacterium 19S3-7]MCF6801718.1 MBL fold metallo-hydrolase [Thiotrichales bacterium 19S3-11]
MKLIFIGSGSAFITGEDNYNSNMLLIDGQTNQSLLIDCGSDARHSLFKAGYSYREITDVYISHLHADHCGGLEWLALIHKFDPNFTEKINLYANESIIKEMWQHSLKAGLSTLENEHCTLETFFNVTSIENNASFIWNHHHFQTVQTTHVASEYNFMPSYGLVFTINNTKIFITTDTQFSPEQLTKLYHEADIIFHDCETSKLKSGVHAHFDELSTLDNKIKSKMWLYHYNSGQLPDASKNGFKGFVKRGQIFEF